MKKNIIITNSISNFLLKRKKIKKNNSIISQTLNGILKNIDKKEDTFHVFSKKFIFDFDKKYLNKFKKYKTIVIVGMGGSILGAKAIYFFLKHKIKKDFLFLDNLNENIIKKFNHRKNLNKTLFVIISKSGNTIETLTNINLIKKVEFNSSNTILITEKSDNAINNFSNKIKTPIIKHKKYIGGRYSVLSEVGMIPAHLMGFKANNFRRHLLDYFKNKKKKFLIDSVSKMSDLYLSKKISSIIFVNYSPQLVHFVYWCQQLIAESLGKNGKGLFPAVSIGPKDHHSLLQLYLDGPKDKMFYILSSKSLYNFKVGKKYIGKRFKFLQNKKLNKIISSQKDSFKTTLKKRNIPFREFYVNNFSEETIGELFSYFILETTMIGKLIKVNPFNQPSVEEVKILTKKYLS